LPAVLLFFLAPIFGEYLLGNLKISEIIYVPFIAPLYGAGALLIRETTRRAGRGSATMLILGVAYGLIEEGLVDQMLFNRFYFAGQDQSSDTYITALGIDAWLTLIVLVMHAIWSTYIPIILVDSIFPEWETRPWLGRTGLIITAAIFVLGSAYLCYTIYLEENFFASAPQLIGTVIVVAVLITIAFGVWGPVKGREAGFSPSPWIAGAFSLAASSLFMLTEMLPGWTKVGVCVLLIIGFFTMVSLWSSRGGWSAMHRLASVGGGILTYAWLGMFMEPESGPKTVFDYIGSAIFTFGAIFLLAIAVRNLRKSEMTPRTSSN
jgi:hypothetical protein